MNAVMEAAPPVTRTEPGRPWRAVVALALFEARRLLTRIPVLFALVVHVGWTGWRTRTSWDGYPALQDADRATQDAPMLVGLAVLLCVNQAVLRAKRRDTERHFAVLLVQPWRRTAAHALSVVPVAGVVALCVAGQFTWEALKPGAVGHGSPGELLVGPLTVLLFGAVGVLLARLVPSVVAAPLLVVFFLLTFVVGIAPGGDERDGTRWLFPVVAESTANTLPSDLLGRPAAWHALYLAGLAVTVALLAVLAGGGRSWTLRAACVGALAVTVLGASAQTNGVPAATAAARERVSVSPEKEQTCVERAGSTYCAFPEWVPRAGTWAATVDRVRSLAGGTARGQKLSVRQRIEARHGMSADSALAPSATPHQVTVGTAWGGNRVPEFSVAVAGVLVAGSEKAATGGLCDGRMVTLMWLALAGGDDPLTDLSRVRLDDSTRGAAVVLSPTEPLYMTAGQTGVVTQLFGRPLKEVSARVQAHWAELTAPKVTTARVADLLGVTAPKGADTCE
ncbi:ABC transporter permease [Streptomyces sp. ALI-76-A]|uniref:ABC transporter permease n=1 Tax=Streptomyces sp. ALI-76-A TaxID=3025736 RepID=UPI00256EB35D|nr:ABC transporter permease [Streptomyces sp. ALI-76-A]MDL5202414.1 ABC transporter permease [Streptomyces sp. ALI-76-A]